jgi:hypothetical protein
MFLVSGSCCVCGLLYSGMIYFGEYSPQALGWIGPIELIVILLVFVIPAFSLGLFGVIIWYLFLVRTQKNL